MPALPNERRECCRVKLLLVVVLVMMVVARIPGRNVPEREAGMEMEKEQKEPPKRPI